MFHRISAFLLAWAVLATSSSLHAHHPWAPKPKKIVPIDVVRLGNHPLSILWLVFPDIPAGTRLPTEEKDRFWIPGGLPGQFPSGTVIMGVGMYADVDSLQLDGSASPRAFFDSGLTKWFRAFHAVAVNRGNEVCIYAHSTMAGSAGAIVPWGTYLNGPCLKAPTETAVRLALLELFQQFLETNFFPKLEDPSPDRPNDSQNRPLTKEQQEEVREQVRRGLSQLPELALTPVDSTKIVVPPWLSAAGEFAKDVALRLLILVPATLAAYGLLSHPVGRQVAAALVALGWMPPEWLAPLEASPRIAI